MKVGLEVCQPIVVCCYILPRSFIRFIGDDYVAKTPALVVNDFSNGGFLAVGSIPGTPRVVVESGS